jgi:hypothetical protein
MQIPAPTGHDARGLERKRRWLRLLFFIAGRIADHWRTRRLHLARAAPWARLLAEVISRLGAIATSSGQQPRQRLGQVAQPAGHSRLPPCGRDDRTLPTAALRQR